MLMIYLFDLKLMLLNVFQSLKQMKIHVGNIEVSGTVMENMELLSIVAFEVIEKYWKSKVSKSN